MNAWLIHGLLGCVALLVIFPLGIIKLWSKTSRWPIPHWAIQATGVLFLLPTAALGLLKSSSLHDPHQVLGLSVVAITLTQMILGHANTLKIRSITTYIYVAHSSLGLSTLLLGWITILTGFRLARVASTPFIVVGLLSATEMCALIAGSLFVRWRAQGVAEKAHGRSNADERGLFTVGEEYDSEDERQSAGYEDKMGSRRRSSSTARALAAV